MKILQLNIELDPIRVKFDCDMSIVQELKQQQMTGLAILSINKAIGHLEFLKNKLKKD